MTTDERQNYALWELLLNGFIYGPQELLEAVAKDARAKGFTVALEVLGSYCKLRLS